MNREEFKLKAASEYPEWDAQILRDEEPFWVPEYRDGWKASHFAETPLVRHKWGSSSQHRRFWQWCKTELSVVPMCFMCDSDNNREWWGFNTEEDLVMFMMKWC